MIKIQRNNLNDNLFLSCFILVFNIEKPYYKILIRDESELGKIVFIERKYFPQKDERGYPLFNRDIHIYKLIGNFIESYLTTTKKLYMRDEIINNESLQSNKIYIMKYSYTSKYSESSKITTEKSCISQVVMGLNIAFRVLNLNFDSFKTENTFFEYLFYDILPNNLCNYSEIPFKFKNLVKELIRYETFSIFSLKYSNPYFNSNQNKKIIINDLKECWENLTKLNLSNGILAEQRLYRADELEIQETGSYFSETESESESESTYDSDPENDLKLYEEVIKKSKARIRARGKQMKKIYNKKLRLRSRLINKGYRKR